MATNVSSPTSFSEPMARRTDRARSRCLAVQVDEAVQTVMPRRIWDGVFGMARTTAAWSSPVVSVRSVAPATIESTTGPSRAPVPPRA